VISVPCSLIKRCKSHFHSLASGVDMIIGTNGSIFIIPTSNPSNVTNSNSNNSNSNNQKINDDHNSSFTMDSTDKQDKPDTKQKLMFDALSRERAARVRNACIVLSKQHIAIWSATVMDVYMDSVTLQLAASELLVPDNWQKICQTALARKFANQ